MINYYNIFILLGIISKLYSIQGTSTINAITIGNKIVQQNDINWSKRILGKEALTQMNTNIKKDVFIAKFKEEEDILTNISYKIELFTSKNKFKIFIIKSKGIILK